LSTARSCRSVCVVALRRGRGATKGGQSGQEAPAGGSERGGAASEGGGKARRDAEALLGRQAGWSHPGRFASGGQLPWLLSP
jgi:hypothetical protein